MWSGGNISGRGQGERQHEVEEKRSGEEGRSFSERNEKEKRREQEWAGAKRRGDEFRLL